MCFYTTHNSWIKIAPGIFNFVATKVEFMAIDVVKM